MEQRGEHWMTAGSKKTRNERAGKEARGGERKKLRERKGAGVTARIWEERRERLGKARKNEKGRRLREVIG